MATKAIKVAFMDKHVKKLKHFIDYYITLSQN